MKLTHENVRAVLAKATFQVGNHVVVRALCEQWLAAHTVRWSYWSANDGGDETVGGELVTNDGRTVADYGCDQTKPRAERVYFPSKYAAGEIVRARACTESEARAWCEEQVCAEGYEVER